MIQIASGFNSVLISDLLDRLESWLLNSQLAARNVELASIHYYSVLSELGWNCLRFYNLQHKTQAIAKNHFKSARKQIAWKYWNLHSTQHTMLKQVQAAWTNISLIRVWKQWKLYVREVFMTKAIKFDTFRGFLRGMEALARNADQRYLDDGLVKDHHMRWREAMGIQWRMRISTIHWQSHIRPQMFDHWRRYAEARKLQGVRLPKFKRTSTSGSIRSPPSNSITKIEDGAMWVKEVKPVKTRITKPVTPSIKKR